MAQITTSHPRSGSSAEAGPPRGKVHAVAQPSDEVDEIVSAWHRERPDLDPSPLHVLSRVSRIARRVATLRQQVFIEHGVESWEFDVLAALRRSGAPYELSPGQLASETMVTSGTMTNRVDRLADRGLVRRARSQTDRRGVTVQLTEPGRTAVDSAFAALLAVEQDLLGAVPEQTRTALADQLRSLLRSLS